MKKIDPENVEDLIRRARLGESEAFTVLYEAYFTPPYRYIYFRVSDESDAADLTQESFLKAYESFPRYVSSGKSPLAFFYTVARNCIIDHYRKKKTVRADDEFFEGIPDDSENAEAMAAMKDDGRSLRQKIAKLPQDQQDALVLRFIDGLSSSEIATILGKSEVAVRQLQSRGLRILRSMMKEESVSSTI